MEDGSGGGRRGADVDAMIESDWERERERKDDAAHQPPVIPSLMTSGVVIVPPPPPPSLSLSLSPSLAVLLIRNWDLLSHCALLQ